MIGEDRVRRLATRLPEVTEKPSYGTPAFYVAGRIFARLREEPGVLVCWRASPDDREILLQADPEKFFTTDHFRRHASVLAELLAEAWEARAPKRLLS